jgi:hypothetical protein
MTADESLAGVLARVRRQVEELAASLPLVAENARREEREACARVVANWVNEFTPSCCGISVERTLGRVEDAIRYRGEP